LTAEDIIGTASSLYCKQHLHITR